MDGRQDGDRQVNGRTDIGTALERVADGSPPLLLDGATGTELERRGVEMVDGLWDALATGSRPDVLREIHADYLRSGSQVVIANTFATSRYVLAEAGYADQFESLNRDAVRLAVEARDAVRPSAWVAGSISTVNFGVLPASLQKARQDYRDQAEIMAAAGADFIILEMMRDVELTAAAADAIRAVGLPCWVGYSVEQDVEGRLVSQERGVPLREMLESLDFASVQAVGVMHSLVEPTGPALEEVAVVWPGPRFAYAHSGGWSMPHWQFDDIIAPDDYAKVAVTWVADGVQAVGGCCGLGPEHIRTLARALL